MEFLVKTMLPFIEKYTLLRIVGSAPAQHTLININYLIDYVDTFFHVHITLLNPYFYKNKGKENANEYDKFLQSIKLSKKRFQFHLVFLSFFCFEILYFIALKAK